MKRNGKIIGIAGLIICLLFTVFAGVWSIHSSTSVPKQKSGENSGSGSKISSNAKSINNSNSSDRNFRAVWITSLSNINFPSKTGLSAAEQEKEIDVIADKVKSIGMNTVILQVRPNADALYKSQYYPWSQVLTGTQGKDPGYDPLAYFIEAAHKRGLSLYAWINPYRVQTKAETSKIADSNPARQHPDWTVTTGDGELYFNPGLPQVQSLIENGVMEIVRNYDVNGIVFDDYYYPSKTFADDSAWKQYANGLALDDWRRNNVTTLIKNIHEKVKTIKKNVPFGVSPFGVWANKTVNPQGSDTSAGVESYYDQYADTRQWVQKKEIDFICPQIYWQIGYSAADYSKLLEWWANTVKGTDVSLYIAHAAYKIQSENWQSGEIINQLKNASKYAQYKGSSFYGFSQLCANTGGISDLLTAYYKNE